MADALTVELVAADRTVWSGEATMVIARTVEGEMGILRGHTPVLSLLADSVVEIDTGEGDVVVAAVDGGFISVANDRVSILSEHAILAADVDVSAERSELEAAQAEEGGDAESRIRRAEARIRAAVDGLISMRRSRTTSSPSSSQACSVSTPGAVAPTTTSRLEPAGSAAAASPVTVGPAADRARSSEIRVRREAVTGPVASTRTACTPSAFLPRSTPDRSTSETEAGARATSSSPDGANSLSSLTSSSVTRTSLSPGLASVSVRSAAPVPTPPIAVSTFQA